MYRPLSPAWRGSITNARGRPTGLRAVQQDEGDAMRYPVGFLLLAPVSVLGFIGAAWSWLFGAALVGVVGYWLMRPMVFTRMREASVLRKSMWPITTYVSAVYVSQLVVCSVLFLAGRAFGRLMGA
jgi:hypothetical protein